MIEDDARFSALILHHLSCRWPDARLTVHRPQDEGAVSPEFLAQGFDAVLLASSGAGDSGLEWLKDLAGRAGFAPVVFVTGGADRAAKRAALKMGAHAVLDRAKIEHDKLIAVLTAAAEKQSIARANWRTAADAHEEREQRSAEAEPEQGFVGVLAVNQEDDRAALGCERRSARVSRLPRVSRPWLRRTSNGFYPARSQTS